MDARQPGPPEPDADDVSARNAETIIRLLTEQTASLESLVTLRRARVWGIVALLALIAGVGGLGGVIGEIAALGHLSTLVAVLLTTSLSILVNALWFLVFGRTVLVRSLATRGSHVTITADVLEHVLRLAVQLEEHAARDLNTVTRVELDLRIQEAERALAHAGRLRHRYASTTGTGTA